MTAVLTFEVSLPYRALGQNSRGNWRKKHRPTALYREEAALVAASAMRAQGWTPPARATVTLEYGTKGGRTVGRYQPRDEANAIDAFKAGYDGIVDAGVVQDDSRKHLHIGGATISNTWGPRVRVRVEAGE